MARKRIVPILLALLISRSGPSQVGGKPSLVFCSLEKQLEEYLRNRVLVFRETVTGKQIRFNAEGKSLQETNGGGSHQAMLFIDLTLFAERLELVGERIEVRFGQSGRKYVRNGQRLDLIRCTLLLDRPAQELTFVKAVAMLLRIFFSEKEWQSSSGSDQKLQQRVDGAPR